MDGALTYPICPFCDQLVTDHEALVRYEEVGWAKYRGAKGGTNTLYLRKRTGRVAHANCIDKAKHEVTGQTGLFD